MFVSPAVLAEYEAVLCRPRFKLDPGRVATVLMVMRSTSTEVFPTRILKISGHASDNRFCECAEAASADFLITGNTKDFNNQVLSRAKSCTNVPAKAFSIATLCCSEPI